MMLLHSGSLTMNRFQRWYFGWAEPYYQRMPAEMQVQARAMDRFLYSRGGLWAWGGTVAGVAGCSLALGALGMPWWLALPVALALVFGLVMGLVTAWLKPDVLARGGLPRVVLMVLLGALLGAALSFLGLNLAGQGARGGLGAMLDELLRVGLPAALLTALLLLLMMWTVASARRLQIQQELARLDEARRHERMAREASEARLRLLQAQIQPHFIFNTLSAVQHWVDSGDARASGLLRALSAFLRGTAELMLKPQVSLAEELALAEQYLRVMQARWGSERLRYQLQAEPALAARAELPPGIVLSLLENALEHGIAPALGGGRVSLHLSAQGPQGWCLELCDDGVGLAPGWQEGLGLGNCRARLEHAFGPAARLRLLPRPEGGTCARLELLAPGSFETPSGETPAAR
ncbi:UNVERIFIED_ORG: histidine kinase [Shinella sp. XGS7]|nr:histidine kinase [Shinella sp. XGS7]